MAGPEVGVEGTVLPRIERRRGPRPSRGQLLARDMISGAVVALVMISYSLSFALLIFSGPLADYLTLGVSLTLMGAALCGALVALTSSFRLAIVGPDTATMAVMSALAAGVAANFSAGQEELMVAHVMAAITVATIFTGVTLFLLGALRAGVWIRYIPYPVLGGFLAAAGWLLSSGAIKVVTGHHVTIAELATFADVEVLVKLAAGVGFAALIFLSRRFTRNDFVLPALLLGGFAVTHVVIAASGTTLQEARDSGWLLPLYAPQAPWLPWASDVWGQLDWGLLLAQSGEFAAATAVTAMAILLNATGLEVWRRTELDLDRDLRAHGWTNVLSGLAGGTVGNLSLNRTVLNYGAGGRTRASGVAMGVICLIVLFVGTELVGFIPTPVLGGLLLFLGLGVLNNWLIKTWRRVSRTEYILILAILTLIIQRSYLEGIALGVVASCIFFALNYSRVRVIKHNMTRGEYGSYVERSHQQNQTLRKYGNEIQILWLQGFLFFGSSNRLLEQIKERVEAPGPYPVRYLVLDFRLVPGMDSSAVMSFIKLRNFAMEKGVSVIFCGMTRTVDRAFRSEGLFGGGGAVTVHPNLDLALEGAEEDVLSQHRAEVGSEPDFDFWLSRELGDPDTAQRFLGYLEPIDMQEGEYLFRQNDDAGALFFVQSGRVSVILERADDTPIRLRSMVGYTVVGEMGLYRAARRAASVIAEQDTRVYRLTSETMSRMEQEDPKVASTFHAFIVRILADRLNFANYEIAALQR